MDTKENGLVDTQPKAPSPLGGGSGVNGTADISGPRKDEVTQPANPEPQPLSAYLRQWSELYRGHQEGISPRGFEEAPQGNVHERAGFLGSDSRLRHGLPLSEKSDATNGTAPMPKDGSARQNELPEGTGRGNE